MSSRRRTLHLSGLAFAVGTGIHLIDHLRRGQGSITELLYVLGNLALVLQITAVVLVLTRHRLGPLAAAAAGFPLAIGFAAAHWLPEWSAMSDPVWEVESLTWFSYLASGAEIVTAVAMGIAGWLVIRDEGLDRVVSERVPA